MSIYRIRNWSTLFENNRTRELKRLEWVPVPNRMDSFEYGTLIDHPNGAAHLGAWLVMLKVASRQDPRGTLPQEGAGLSQALAVMSRLPAGLFDEVIPRLLKLQWIEHIATLPQEGAGIPQEGAVEGKGIEGKGRERRERNGTLVSQYRTFLEKWQEPDASGKVFSCADVDLGCQVWMGLIDSGRITDQTLPEVFAGLKRWRGSAQWKKGLVHSVSTWLGFSKNGTPGNPRWNDKPEPAAPESEY